MKKEKIKNIFEDNLKDVKVSRALKDKTLNKIYSKNNVYHFPVWLKNCAAIFIVTCICLSMYLINNKSQFTNDSNNVISNSKTINQETTSTTQINDLNKTNSIMMKSSKPSSNYYVTESLATENDNLRESGSIMMDNLKEQEIEILTEKEFLMKNPDAKETTEGYIVIENNIEVIYIFKNGIFIEKI